MQHQMELGPIDYLVIEFGVGSREFDGVLTRSIARLVDGGVIRVLDLLIITKSDAGEIDVVEIEDLEGPEFAPLKRSVAEIFAYEDVTNLAMAIKPGTSAGAIIFEHTAVAAIGAATHEIGAQIIAQGRIPASAIIATLSADRSEVD